MKINQFGQFVYARVLPILSELEKTKSELVTMIDPNKGTVNLSFLHSLAQKFIPTIISEFVKSEENRQIKFLFQSKVYLRI